MAMAMESETRVKSPWQTPAIEKTFVHGVYDAIAPHFSSTRFARWPKVSLFLGNLPPGSLVLDAGCGNGKYLGLNPNCFFVGCDLSSPLVAICSQREGERHEVMVADTLHLPFRGMFFDGAISIAVLHHLSTEQRRRKAVEELARVVRKGGRILITVWAVEQEDKSLVGKWTPLTSRYAEEEWVGAGASGSLSRSRTKIPAPALHRIEEHHDISNTNGSSSSSSSSSLASSSASSPSSSCSSSVSSAPSSSSSTSMSSSSCYLSHQDAIHSLEKCSISGHGAICGLEDHGISDHGGTDHSGLNEENGSGNHGLSDRDVVNDIEIHGSSDRGVMALHHGLQNQTLPNREATEGSEGPAGTMETVNVEQQDFFVPWHLPFHRAEIGGASAAAVASGFARKDEKKSAVVYNRYYHVFANGELERLVSDVHGVVVVDQFYDKSNWCVILEKL